MKHWRFVVAAILVAGLPQGARSAGPAASPAQCEAALYYARVLIAEIDDRPVVFATGTLFLGEVPRGTEGWYRSEGGRGVPVSAPPVALLDAVTGANALGACSSLGARLTALHIRRGEAPVRWATGRRRDGSYRAVILALSLPVVSADGQHAVLGASTISGPLGGGGMLIHLDRNAAGQWQVAGWIGLWIS